MSISAEPAVPEEISFKCGVPLPEGATTAQPPTKEEVKELLTVTPRYGIEITPLPVGT